MRMRETSQRGGTSSANEPTVLRIVLPAGINTNSAKPTLSRSPENARSAIYIYVYPYVPRYTHIYMYIRFGYGRNMQSAHVYIIRWLKHTRPVPTNLAVRESTRIQANGVLLDRLRVSVSSVMPLSSIRAACPARLVQFGIVRVGKSLGDNDIISFAVSRYRGGMARGQREREERGYSKRKKVSPGELELSRCTTSH